MKNLITYQWNMQSLLIVTLIVLFFSGCQKADLCDCMKGTGKEITVSRPASPFKSITLNKKADLHIHYDTTYRITVSAGEKVIDDLTTSISNGNLQIENNNKCNWVRNFDNSFRVDVYTPGLTNLEIENSSGNIYFEDTLTSENFLFQSWESSGDYFLQLNCGTVTIALQTGPASIYASGKIGVGYLWNSGGGKFDALALHADDIYSTNIGTNDLLLYPEKRLEAFIGYSGNIYIKGNPPIKQLQDNGAGTFITL